MDKNTDKKLWEWTKSITFALAIKKYSWCHSSVGRAKDWKSLCPRFDSWWHHNLKSYSFRVTLFLYIRGCSGLRCTNRQARCLAQLVEQRTDIVYKLALCPRFDSWWHHNYFFLKRQYWQCLTILQIVSATDNLALPIVKHCRTLSFKQQGVLFFY